MVELHPRRHAYARAQISRDSPKAYCSIRPYAWLLIVGGFCQILQKLPVDYPVGQFVDDRENSFHCLFADNRRYVGKPGNLSHVIKSPPGAATYEPTIWGKSLSLTIFRGI